MVVMEKGMKTRNTWDIKISRRIYGPVVQRTRNMEKNK
jgi:hypothetical protein